MVRFVPSIGEFDMPARPERVVHCNHCWARWEIQP
jgi:hypothetical protein